MTGMTGMTGSDHDTNTTMRAILSFTVLGKPMTHLGGQSVRGPVLGGGGRTEDSGTALGYHLDSMTCER
jgi:hypothetical protein